MAQTVPSLPQHLLPLQQVSCRGDDDTTATTGFSFNLSESTEMVHCVSHFTTAMIISFLLANLSKVRKGYRWEGKGGAKIVVRR